jgi:hypothetical protein
VSVTAYHSFAGEVEASNTPTIRRLTLSRRHQLSPIARASPAERYFRSPRLEIDRMGAIAAILIMLGIIADRVH